MSRVFGVIRDAVSRAIDASVFGPSTTLADLNAMIEVHEDTPPLVMRRFRESGVTRLRFQFLETPVEEQMSPTYEQIGVLGRSEAYYSYSGGNNRVIGLNLAFASSAEQYEDRRTGFDTAVQNVRWLQALTLPSYSGGLSYPPPLCRLVLGRAILARGVITNVSPSFEVWSGEESPFEYPIVCRASLEFTVVSRRPPEARDFLPYAGRARPV